MNTVSVATSTRTHLVYPAGWLLGQAMASRVLRNANLRRRTWTIGVAALLSLGLVVQVMLRPFA